MSAAQPAHNDFVQGVPPSGAAPRASFASILNVQGPNHKTAATVALREDGTFSVFGDSAVAKAGVEKFVTSFIGEASRPGWGL